ncbi:MerR family transcriptional regulator [Actinomadura yumaensis]|uniref:MerR family transcriptional regulator n=1 Tax=Actinomadura yumaensis TaxID=111807 RepID=UPI0036103D98
MFAAVHRDALLTYRALARGFGTGRAQEVMLAVHGGDVAEALALVDAGHAALHEERLSLRAAGEALEAVASGRAPDEAFPARAGMRIGEVARLLGVRTSALRVWEDAGLLAPGREPGTGYRVFGPADVRDARMVDLLRRSRHPVPLIRPILDGLRRTGSSDALREAIAQRGQALTRRASAMLAACALLHAYLSREDVTAPVPRTRTTRPSRVARPTR